MGRRWIANICHDGPCSKKVRGGKRIPTLLLEHGIQCLADQVERPAPEQGNHEHRKPSHLNLRHGSHGGLRGGLSRGIDWQGRTRHHFQSHSQKWSEGFCNENGTKLHRSWTPNDHKWSESNPLLEHRWNGPVSWGLRAQWLLVPHTGIHGSEVNVQYCLVPPWVLLGRLLQIHAV